MTTPLHMQQQVLDAIKAVLAAGGTAAGASRVYVDRLDTLAAASLPAILIAEGDDGETAQPFSVHGHEQRDLQVLVRCITPLTADHAAEARAFGLQVEKLLAADTTLRALCKAGVRIAGSRLAIDAEGEYPYAERAQTWVFSYICLSTTPDVAA